MSEQNEITTAIIALKKDLVELSKKLSQENVQNDTELHLDTILLIKDIMYIIDEYGKPSNTLQELDIEVISKKVMDNIANEFSKQCKKLGYK